MAAYLQQLLNMDFQMKGRKIYNMRAQANNRVDFEFGEEIFANKITGA